MVYGCSKAPLVFLQANHKLLLAATCSGGQKYPIHRQSYFYLTQRLYRGQTAVSQLVVKAWIVGGPSLGTCHLLQHCMATPTPPTMCSGIPLHPVCTQRCIMPSALTTPPPHCRPHHAPALLLDGRQKPVGIRCSGAGCACAKWCANCWVAVYRLHH